jgi:hypothetical protein
MLPNLDVGDIVYDKHTGIGTKLIYDILKYAKLYTINESFPTKKSLETQQVYLEDITIYDNIFHSITEDKKSKMYILKNKNKYLLTCFEPRKERIQVRTLQQKLADVTTTEVIRRYTDKQYTKVFIAFYKTMDKVLREYCKIRKLSCDKDVILFYKGGNVFRILLNEITKIIDDEEYRNLMKRSDADFQIFIHPKLENVEIIRKEVAVLVIYVLEKVRDFVRTSKVTRFSLDQLDNIKEQYQEELKKTDLKIKDIFVVYDGEAARQDMLIDIGKIAKNATDDCVIVKHYPSLIKELAAIPKRRANTFFLSYNRMLDFERKDNLRATFELIRLRRNFRLDVTLDDQQDKHVFVNVPLEIIDVSIPHGEDLGLKKLANSDISQFIRTYKFQENIRDTSNKIRKNISFQFKAPTLKYQLKDLHDLLFYQNEYPWLDIKYNKRMTRYFLSMFLFQIVEHISMQKYTSHSIESVLNNISNSYDVLKTHLQACIDNGGTPPDGNILSKNSFATSYVSVLYDEYMHLLRKVRKEPESDRDKIMKNLKTFTKTIIVMLSKLMNDINRIKTKLSNTNTQTRINDLYTKLFERGQTNIL